MRRRFSDLGYLTITSGVGFALWYMSWVISTHKSGGRLGFVPIILLAIGAWFVPAGLPLWWRKDRSPLGLRITPHDQPRLFDKASKAASITGQVAPAELYLTEDLDFAVYQLDGFMGLGARLVPCIGLPVFHFLNVSQLEAVLAYLSMVNRDGFQYVWPWLRLTEISLRMDKHTLGRFPALYRYLDGYEQFYTSLAKPIFRQETLTADRRVAAAKGSEVWAGALMALERNQTAFAHYLADELDPAVERGYHPPVMDGFHSYVKIAQAGIKTGKRSDHYAGRRDSIADLPAGTTADSSPAISVLDDVSELESKVLMAVAPDGTEELRPIPWTQAAYCSILPNWNRLCRLHAYKLKGLTLKDLPKIMPYIDVFAIGTPWESGSPVWPQLARAYSKDVLTAALGRALTRDGWYIDHVPGALCLRRLDHTIDPLRLLEQMESAEFTNDQWLEMLTRWELDPALSLEA
jgi:hypothetical protein